MALNIVAISYVSLSEIQTVNPEITLQWTLDNPDEFKQMLYELGGDVYNYPYEVQDVTHRNRFGNIVTCPRYVCNERTDAQWVKSEYASIEAKDKSLNNKLLIESYKSRGLVDLE